MVCSVWHSARRGNLLQMDDVFDLTGHPPKGWVHAVFHDGPYSDDVGRCVPGPPTPDPLEVELPGGGTFVYRILSVGFTHVDMEVDDLLVVYAGEIPAESDNEEWWAERGGRWR